MGSTHRVRSSLRVWNRVRRDFGRAVLRLLVAAFPSERQRLFWLTILLGAVCGLVAVLFHITLRVAEEYLIGAAMGAHGRTWIAWTIILPVLGGLAGGALLAYVVPEARGSGIPQVKVAYAIRGGKVPLYVAVGKFLIGTLQIGTGASLGREGPTVQICAGVTSWMGQVAALSQRSLRSLVPVSAAAGIAAAFNAPIAAVTFTIEEIVGDLDHTILSGIVVAAAIAAMIERVILGEHPVFDVPAGYGLHYTSSLILYAVLGVAAAFASLAFTEGLLFLRGRFRRLSSLPVWMHPAVGGLVTGILAVTAIALAGSRGIPGSGYDALSEALIGKLTLQAMLLLCVLKLGATVFSYASGGAGGIFAPALFIGGMLGGAVGVIDTRLFGHDPVEVGAFALVGMGAVFAGILRAPITSVLIIFEMTGAYGLVLPLMIANTIAYGVARRYRPTQIYEALLEQDGVHLPHATGAVGRVLERITVSEAMTRDPVSLDRSLTVKQALGQVAQLPHSFYPVVDDHGRMVGFVSKARLRRYEAEEKADEVLDRVAERRECVHPDHSLVRALVRMNRASVRQLAVTSRDREHVVGVVSLTDIVAAQARALASVPDVDQTIPQVLRSDAVK